MEPLASNLVTEFSPEPSRSRLARYALAVVLSGAAALLTHIQWSIFAGIPFLPLFLAIFIAGWWGGGGPSFLVTILGTVSMWYWIFEPRLSFAIHDPLVAVRLAFFLTVGTLFSVLHRHVWKQKELQAVAMAQARAAESEARDALEMRNRFLSIAAHEIRNPLSALTLITETLASDPLPHAAAEKVVRLQRRMNGMVRLAEQLLDLSRIHEARMALKLETFDLGPMIREAAAGAPASPRVEVRLPETAVMIRADPTRLEQAITNLLSNAAKFGGGLPIRIEVRDEGTLVAITVTDGGSGVRPADRERIFELFQRGSGQERREGLGLGLWLTRRIAEAHGGTVELEGPEERGARFVLRIPLHSAEMTPR